MRASMPKLAKALKFVLPGFENTFSEFKEIKDHYERFVEVDR